MTDHTHATIVEGCFRCELNKDELPDTATLLGLGAEDSVADLPYPDRRLLDTIETPQDRNRQRGLFAGHALKAYADRTRGDGIIGEALGDLLGDLRHLCDALELDFDALLERSDVHYDAEIHGEG